MIKITTFNFDKNKIPLCQFAEEKITINRPTGNFFYDNWEIQPQYKNTIWEQILCSLPNSIGEARIIKLISGRCYFSHADIDDRWHLNLSGSNSFLVDLENNILYETKNDGVWYEMDGGILHSAVNFGEDDRYQLVVRKLLQKNYLENACMIKIWAKGKNPRFRFDNAISPWLNRSVKNGTIDNFTYCDNFVCFDIEKKSINDIMGLVPTEFEVEVK